ncbi:hypothetical protein DFH08DRAFT_800173 [Mycena albidolilacea]|uniref:Uncharacterized protein n=1 Tax=Mycena albidolilacea TaxID=1033008 RepID=A0AAD7F1Y2_9AGAR|nr:hypothetical protein DFH08DRAFT_800173 [Mycena albidolilacea]
MIVPMSSLFTHILYNCELTLSGTRDSASGGPQSDIRKLVHSPAVGFPWSNDWDDWPLLKDLFAEPSPRIELLKDVYGLSGTIEPLVYAPGAPDQYFMFTVGGWYYFRSDEELFVHETEFVLPKEFLDHALKEQENQPKLKVPMLSREM